MTPAARIWHAGVIVAAFVLVGSCTTAQVGIPAAPSELTTGVSIYENANFQGHSALITQDISNLAAFAGPCPELCFYQCYDLKYTWQHCISSIRVAPGWRATIYTNADFRGESLDVTADVPNLALVNGPCGTSGFDDCSSSIRVRQQ